MGLEIIRLFLQSSRVEGHYLSVTSSGRLGCKKRGPEGSSDYREDQGFTRLKDEVDSEIE